MGDKDKDLGERDFARRGMPEGSDAEGHGFRGNYGPPDTDHPPSDEAEGHGARWGGIQPDQPPRDEAEGHALKPRYASPDDEPPRDESEGHAASSRHLDQPPSDEPATERSGEPPKDDTEGNAVRWSDRNRKVNVKPVTW